ncbi:uncharacterized protein C8Q71DRAFT_875816, partial [Rhodofomes roseus]
MSKLHYYENCDVAQWHHCIRIPPDAFWEDVDAIKDHHIFQNNSNNRQMEVELQLAIHLYRAGRYGTGAVGSEIAYWAGVSLGTIYNCSRRCMIALLSLHDDAIVFRDEAQVEGAKACAEKKAGTETWRNGFLSADGTPIKLFTRPGWFGNDFYGKDKIYAL